MRATGGAGSAWGGVSRWKRFVRAFPGWALQLSLLLVVAVAPGILFAGPAAANTLPVLDGNGNMTFNVTNSYGISALSQGSNGSDGQDATAFTGSTPGGGGTNAGNVAVSNHLKRDWE